MDYYMERYLPVGITLLTILSNSFGGNIKEISDKYKSSYDITPAPFTFSIWGLIYGLLIYVTFTHYSEILNIETEYGSILNLFIISSILNALWIQAWGKNLELSSIILLSLASILILITNELNKARVDKILIYTFGIYTAWALVASLLNLSTLFINKNIIEAKYVKLIVMGILTILPFLIKDVFKNIFGDAIIPMLLTIIWASFGIIMNGSNNIIFITPVITSTLNIFL
jgi:benzodiazapine receptor